MRKFPSLTILSDIPTLDLELFYLFPSFIYLVHAANILKVVYYVLGTVDTTENRDSQGPWLSDLDYN